MGLCLDELTLVRLLLRRLMSDVMSRMLVIHTKMSINCNQSQPRRISTSQT